MQHTVNVNRGEGDNLIVDQPQVNIQHVDSVQWVFPALGQGELAFLHFHSPAQRPFGPFQTLVHLGSSTPSPSILAIGNTGDGSPSSYTALILNEHGPVATSDGTALIINHSTDPDSSPEATVRVVGETISVEPLNLKVPPGQTAVWYIRGLDAGQIVTFDFLHSGNPMLGPFSSFTVSRGFETARVAFGINFLDPRPAHSTVPYQVQLRNLDGKVLDFDDPTIEPLGPPPGGNG
jgi:hypothetical protein